MKITYLYHSGFSIEFEGCMFIIDYYKSDKAPVLPEGKPVFFLASHTHPDHFSPIIFKYNGPNVTYILSEDIREKVEHRGWLDGISHIDIRYIKPYEALEIGPARISTLKSTDRGVAFIIDCEGKKIYHAGDLNEWNMDKDRENKALINNMRALYRREIDRLSGLTLDAAFIPVDHRLGSFYSAGPLYFLKQVNVKMVIPMHMWDHYEYVQRLIEEPDLPAELKGCIVSPLDLESGEVK